MATACGLALHSCFDDQPRRRRCGGVRCSRRGVLHLDRTPITSTILFAFSFTLFHCHRALLFTFLITFNFTFLFTISNWLSSYPLPAYQPIGPTQMAGFGGSTGSREKKINSRPRPKKLEVKAIIGKHFLKGKIILELKNTF